MRVPGEMHGFFNLLRRQSSMSSSQCAHQQSRQFGRAGTFIIQNVRILVENNLIARRRLRREAGLIAHCSGWNKECGLFAENFCNAFLQAVDGRILTKDIVADLRLRHSLSHSRGRLGDGVASQVNGKCKTHGTLELLPEANNRPC